jgi:hypothetical protein
MRHQHQLAEDNMSIILSLTDVLLTANAIKAGIPTRCTSNENMQLLVPEADWRYDHQHLRTGYSCNFNMLRLSAKFSCDNIPEE